MPSNLTPYLLALSAGLAYSVSALFAKRALELGSGASRSLIYSNWVTALFFLPYPLLADSPLQASDFQNGALLGTIFFVAQSLCFAALRSSDASMVTPIMGSKSVFVALFLFLFGLSPHPIGLETWAAAGLAATAVALIGWPSKAMPSSFVGIFLALGTAAGFGLVDSMVPHFTHQSDPFNIMFVMFSTLGLLSFSLIPLSRGNFLASRGRADRWMWASSLPMGGQAVLMSFAIGFFRVPTEANVFYSCRGLWAILLVAWLGKRMGLHESNAPSSTQIRRIIGASLLLLGIYLAPVGS